MSTIVLGYFFGSRWRIPNESPATYAEPCARQELDNPGKRSNPSQQRPSVFACGCMRVRMVIGSRGCTCKTRASRVPAAGDRDARRRRVDDPAACVLQLYGPAVDVVVDVNIDEVADVDGSRTSIASSRKIVCECALDG